MKEYLVGNCEEMDDEQMREEHEEAVQRHIIEQEMIKR